jgi:KaiC/GvpD/RAD55 family RecA-like ATPase
VTTSPTSTTSRAQALTRTAVGQLNTPSPALVETLIDGTPRVVNRELVTVVREEWRVVDRWWTDEPVDRRYFEVVLESGRNVCVFRDREKACWFTQRA